MWQHCPAPAPSRRFPSHPIRPIYSLLCYIRLRWFIFWKSIFKGPLSGDNVKNVEVTFLHLVSQMSASLKLELMLSVVSFCLFDCLFSFLRLFVLTFVWLHLVSQSSASPKLDLIILLSSVKGNSPPNLSPCPAWSNKQMMMKSDVYVLLRNL